MTAPNLTPQQSLASRRDRENDRRITLPQVMVAQGLTLSRAAQGFSPLGPIARGKWGRKNPAMPRLVSPTQTQFPLYRAEPEARS